MLVKEQLVELLRDHTKLSSVLKEENEVSWSPIEPITVH